MLSSECNEVQLLGKINIEFLGKRSPKIKVMVDENIGWKAKKIREKIIK